VVSAALALIPAGCNCVGQIKRLENQAARAGVAVYVVGRGGSSTEARELAADIKGAHVAIDSGNVLTAFASSHLTIVLVDSHQNVTRPALTKKFDLVAALKSLLPAP
jgi:D-arabinose 1-dehydrogenase-like Zn-dependent alcohol dehydrogenase